MVNEYLSLEYIVYNLILCQRKTTRIVWLFTRSPGIICDVWKNVLTRPRCDLVATNNGHDSVGPQVLIR